MNANWIDRILPRNFLLIHVIEGNIEGKIEVPGRPKPQMDDLEEKRGQCSF